MTTTGSFVTSDGIRLAYYVDDYTDPWRAPDTLLMLHSAMGSARRYYAMVPALARRFRVVRLDLRGHGASEVPALDVPFSLARLAQDAVELLDHLQVRQAHVVGASAGGFVTQRLAMAHPERVRSISLLASKPGLKRSQASSWLAQVEKKGLRAFLAETISDRFPVGEVEPGQIEWFLDETAKNHIPFIAKFIAYMTTQDFMDEVPNIRCPTLMLAPGAEPIGSIATYHEMKSRVRDGELIVYEGARHNINDYLADRCAADILAFLERRFGGEPASYPARGPALCAGIDGKASRAREPTPRQ